MGEYKESLGNISMKHKEKEKLVLPKGAKEIKRTVDVTVEEIENGYLITKRIELQYQMPEKSYTDYTSCCKKYYSLTCPIKVNNKNKELADLFD